MCSDFNAASLRSWSGQDSIGLPPRPMSALIWPSSGARISSANAAVGMPLALSHRPCTRLRALPITG